MAMESAKRKILVVGKADVAVYIDSYEHGEGDYINGWDFNVSGVYDTVQALIDRISKESYCFTNKLEDYVFCGGSIQTDALVDNENFIPSEAQIQRWKEGTETLYDAHLYLSAYTIADMHDMTDEEATELGLEVY